MRHAMAMWSMCGMLAALTGCGYLGGGESKAAGKVAVVDLDEIARRLGRSKEMDDAVSEKQSEANAKLGNLQSTYIKQFEKKQKEFGEHPTDDEQQKLADLQVSLNQRLGNAQQQAANDLAAFRQSLIQGFREEIRPLAQQIATDRGMSVVVTKNDAVVFAYEPECDITDAVVGKLAGGKVARNRKASAAPDYLPDDSGREVTPISAEEPVDEGRYR